MSEVAPGRPRGLAGMGQAFAAMFRPQEIGAAIQGFRPRPTDVVISPFGKCGTTWLQQIFHTLRTRGDMDFDDISRVVPWIETSVMLGLDLETPQRAEPRGFKSHLAWGPMPKGGRYIVSLRDPKDAFLSMYRFMEGWFFEPGTVSIEEFAEVRLKAGPEGQDYWTHLVSWWEVRERPDVLLLSYEQMIAEPEAAIRKVAGFCGIALDDELLALTLERSSIGFMLAHKDRFDDAMMRRLSEVRCGIPAGSDTAKVRQGGSGGGRDLPASVAALLDARWAQAVAPKLGFEDYAALEAELRRG